MSVSSIDTDSTEENHHVHPMEEDQGGDILNTEQEESSFITDSDETEHSGSELAAPARVKEPEPSIAPQTDNKTDSASKTVTQAPDKNSQAKLPTNAQHHPILDHLAEVDVEMGHFQEYVRKQKDGGRPLYQWVQYTDYSAISRAVCNLDEVVGACKQIRIPREQVAPNLARARGYSTSVSRSVAYVLRAMSEKTEKYADELGGSSLSSEAKTKAHSHIIEEVKKVLEHSTLATKSVWAAADLLQGLEKSSTEKFVLQKRVARCLATTALTAGFSAAIGILAANLHLFAPATYDLALKVAHGDSVYSQVLDLVQRTQDVTNLTSEIYTVKLQDLGQRYEDLTAMAESHGLRIDNLVDALGPTNEEGNYYLSTSKEDDSPSEDIGDRLYKISDDSQRQMRRLHEEMELMRKNMHRLDLRLTRRLDRISGS